ncbi:MAG: glycoside hydrolase family 3 N-terminal domain-containing protein [Pseudomonadota bacterium]
MSSPSVAGRVPVTFSQPEVAELLSKMTFAEKVGQLWQVNVGEGYIPEDVAHGIRTGHIGSILNLVDVALVNELQRIAREESRLGIPLLVARDVIHGFRTVMPIPFAQAASWNPDVVESGGRIAAAEAAACGVNWTFAPMLDVARDPRWGRIAESLGEDPWLAAHLGAAMVRGFQGDDLRAPGSIAACAKHFAGYGTAESGRDYATTNVPENEMRNVYLRPFQAAAEAGVASFMTSFSDIDGVPATASEFLLRTVLRGEWSYDGVVISDWDSVRQLAIHGLTANDYESAEAAATAGVDIEMQGDAYHQHLAALVEKGRVDADWIDAAAGRVLALKFRLGLFDDPYTDPEEVLPPAPDTAFAVARQAAVESVVLLKNDQDVLPLQPKALTSLAVIGPLANAPREQLGTWIFDGDAALSVTPLAALTEALGDQVTVNFEPALATSRSRDTAGFDAAVAAAAAADAVILFLGEEAILSGEAHSRADIDLPGAQPQLVEAIASIGKPVVAVIMAGRPLTLTNVVDHLDAVLFAGHLGTMAGPALADLLLGNATPRGKLPATLPRMVGQVPIYYAQKNTGKPPSPHSAVLIDDIDANAEQLSTGMTAYHLDAGYRPLYPFGYGLSYTTFAYENIAVDQHDIGPDDSVTLSADVINTGHREGTETVQLYVRDLVGSVTRPVRELRGYRHCTLAPGERQRVSFTLTREALGFYGRGNQFGVEAGDFHAWIGGDSDASLHTWFRLLD